MIIRRRHTRDFTTIGNKLFDDERLAADEVGIVAYLLSRPHDWEVRRSALMRRWGIGREAVRRIIRNLVRYGYCRAERKRLENGTTFVIYEIRDEPGPELTEDEAKRALALESSAAASVEIDGENPAPNRVREDDDPCTGYPSTADPPPADPSPANIYIPNKDLTKDESTQKAEREYAREREKHALNLVEFKRRWPTAASDDQARIDHAWFDLSPEDGTAALAGIGPFVAKLKADKRTTVPAGWKYLKEKRWTLLEQAAKAEASTGYLRDSIEGRALIRLHDVCGVGEGYRKIYCRDAVTYRKEMTPQIKAFASPEFPPREKWVPIDHRQARSWTDLCKLLSAIPRTKIFHAGDAAPWPWPPSIEGKIYPITGPPETLMSEADMATDFH